MVGDATFNPVETTSAGAAAGADFYATQFNGAQEGFAKGMIALIEEGTHDSKYAYVAGAGSTDPKQFTIQPALGSAIASAITIYLHHASPILYKRAFNQAVFDAHPYVHVVGMDSSLTVTANTVEYTLPSGYTQKTIRRVMMEGEGDYDNFPVSTLRNYTFNPGDATKLWLNQKPGQRPDSLIVGRKIYLVAEKYLTTLTLDTAFGTITADSTATMELTLNTNAFELFLWFARAALFSLVASEPATQNRLEMTGTAADARTDALLHAQTLAMPRVPLAGFV